MILINMPYKSHIRHLTGTYAYAALLRFSDQTPLRRPRRLTYRRLAFRDPNLCCRFEQKKSGHLAKSIVKLQWFLSNLQGYTSYESYNFPDYFIHHQNSALKITRRANSEQYRKEASFLEIEGK